MSSGDDPYAAFKDAEGQPQLWPSRVLFFDLLGISAMSKSPGALGHLRGLRPALQRAIERAATEERDFDQVSTWFTDNAVVAAPVGALEQTEWLLGGAEVSAAYLIVVCWQSGYLGRGAITVGEHYMDERFVYGPALVEAVELEKAARWPRIVLGETAIELERQHSRFYSDVLQSEQSLCLLRDEEGVVFVDALGIYIDEEDDPQDLDRNLKALRDATERGLVSCVPYSEPWLKWRWLADYQNHALAGRLSDPDPYVVPVGPANAQFASFLDPTWGTAPGSPWYRMDRQSRSSLAQPDVAGFLPAGPATYATYREDGERLWVGAARNLSARLEGGDLRATQAGIKKSALARAFANDLGIAKSDAIASGNYVPTADDVAHVHAELRQCFVACTEFGTFAMARDHARDLLEQFRPRLYSSE